MEETYKMNIYRTSEAVNSFCSKTIKSFQTEKRNCSQNSHEKSYSKNKAVFLPRMGLWDLESVPKKQAENGANEVQTFLPLFWEVTPVLQMFKTEHSL